MNRYYGDLSKVFNSSFLNIQKNNELYNDLRIKTNPINNQIVNKLNYYYNDQPITENKIENFVNNNLKEDDDTIEVSCEDIIEHVKKCKYCSSKLRQPIVKTFFTNEVLDLILYIISGIFILFMFHLFFKLGAKVS